MAELTEGEGRGLTKIKVGGPSPVSSPNRRRAVSSISASTALNPLSPRTVSILAPRGSNGGTAPGNMSPASLITATTSFRALSALEEHRSNAMDGSPRIGSLYAPARKVTSAPDSQSYHASQRTYSNPWRPAAPPDLMGSLPAQAQSPSRLGIPTVHLPPSSPPSHSTQATAALPIAWGATAPDKGPSPASTPPRSQPPGNAHGPPSGLAPLSAAIGGRSGRQRRDSASSTDSHSTGVFDSPVGPNSNPGGTALRLTSLGRTTGSPNSPSTPSSLPHTPTCSALKPRPPGEAPAVPSRHSRKLSLLAASPEHRPAARQPQPPQSSGGAVQDECSGPMRTNSGGGAYGSLPETPCSGSRPTSGRGGSARVAVRPVQALVDAVRSKDDAKLAETIELLKAPNGQVQGLNERHHKYGRTPLHEAVMSNNTAMVAALLAAGADPNAAHETQGPPLLHSAAFGEVTTTELLLLENADVHAADVEGFTALHFACAGGHVETARLLIKYGADVRARNAEGQAPFDLAAPEMLRILLAAAAVPGDGNSPDRRQLSRPGSGSTAGAADMPPRAPTSAGSQGGGTPVHRRTSGSVGSGGQDAAAAAAASSPAAGSAAGAASGLKPSPPAEPAGVAGASRLRARRDSGTQLAAGNTAAGQAAPGPQAPALPSGSSPLRAGDPATATSTPTAGPAAAPASPLLSDGEAAPPPSPPTLRLPGGVRRQLSKGAVFGDIISAFRREDADIVNRSQPPHVPAAQHSAVGSASHQRSHGVADAAAHVASPSTAATPGFSGPFRFGVPTPSAASPFPQPQPQQYPLPAMPSQPNQDTTSGSKQQAPPPQQQLFAIAVPDTSVIRFGVPIHVHKGEADAESAEEVPEEEASQPTPPAVPMPSFSAGIQPPVVAPPAAPSPAAGFSAVGFTPVPATGFTPRLSNNGAAGGLGWLFGAPPRSNTAAAGPGSAPPPRTSNSGVPPMPRVSGNGGGALAYRMSGSGDDFGGPTPPLVRDSSPVRSRAGNDVDAPAGGHSSAHVSGSAGSAGSAGGGRGAPTRTSHLAAQALRRISNTNVSSDAIEMRAAALFRQSLELTTGGLQWTRGELLGEGAYGKVYAGLNQQTGELMAVKVMQVISKNGCKEEVKAQLESLQCELSLYKKLKHKHVVGYIDAHYDTKSCAFYMFLEYVPGGSIASMLARFSRFSEDLVRNYTRQLLLGLEYLHGCKIVHRDLKGGNVLVTRDGVIKLADFGASKAYKDHTITDCMKSVRGSVFWMAPEVIRGTGYGRRADIWSLGCTVVEMLTGAHPWPHLDNQWTAMFTIAKSEEGPPRPKNVSPDALRFLDKCLQFDPQKRPTAAELLQDPFVARAPGANLMDEDKLQHSF